MGIDADMFNSPEWMSEALRIGNTGLWAIEIDEENGKHRMTANETMLLLLGLETHPSPEDCFRHWYGRVDEAYRAAVDECVGKMLSTGQRYEVQYPWLHPVCGRIFVRCGGLGTSCHGCGLTFAQEGPAGCGSRHHASDDSGLYGGVHL